MIYMTYFWDIVKCSFSRQPDLEAAPTYYVLYSTMSGKMHSKLTCIAELAEFGHKLSIS